MAKSSFWVRSAYIFNQIKTQMSLPFFPLKVGGLGDEFGSHENKCIGKTELKNDIL